MTLTLFLIFCLELLHILDPLPKLSDIILFLQNHQNIITREKFNNLNEIHDKTTNSNVHNNEGLIFSY